MNDSKRTVLDLVGLVHNFRGEPKTSLLAVCDDGALRGWIINSERKETNVWRSIMLANNCPARESGKKDDVEFPITFFETCQAIQDVEFSSPQLARIYNKHQLKQRLGSNHSLR